MSFAADLKVLYHLACTPIRGQTHADRLESFYHGQAAVYDSFRERLLKGREELIHRLDLPEGAVWLDLGGGTGANLEFAADRLPRLSRVFVVDLCPSLLQIAEERIRRRGWNNVIPVTGDATAFLPPEPVDVVTFSYSLTMIPEWYAAIDHALSVLKPGGRIGVVDFYVSRKHREEERSHHGWLTRSLLPLWFGSDNVFLNADHIPYLHRRFEPVSFAERRAKIPYVPLLRAPYYTFIGRKST